jgi:hypothetical protein
VPTLHVPVPPHHPTLFYSIPIQRSPSLIHPSPTLSMLHPRTCQICSISMLPVPPPAIHISSISRHRSSSQRVRDSRPSTLALPNASTPPPSTLHSSKLLNQREVKFRWKMHLLFSLLHLPLYLLHRSRSRLMRSPSPHPLPAPEMSHSRSKLTEQPQKFEMLPPPYPPALQEDKHFLTPRSAEALPIFIQSSTLSMAIKPVKRKRTLSQELSGQKTILPGLMIIRRPNLTMNGTQQPSLHRETRSILPPNGCAETTQVRGGY